MNNSGNKNYHFLQNNNIFKNQNINKKTDHISIVNTHRLPLQANNINGSEYSKLNNNIYGSGNSNANKFLNNVNSTQAMNFQERVINFGQDLNENSFKKNLRKPTLSNTIQNNSFNIITGVPYSQTKYNKSYATQKINSDKIDDMFYSYNNQYNKKFSPIKQKDNVVSPNVKNKSQYFTVIKNTSTNDSLSVKEYSYKEDQNLKCRNTMEDVIKIIDNFNRVEKQGFFSLYDGHGGINVANYAKERMPEVFERLINSSKDKKNELNYYENLLISSFQKIDDELKFEDNVGSTATVVFITNEKDNTRINNQRRVLYCANVGDSRCILLTNYGTKRLSYDHKVSDISEASRINASGGVIFAGRVYGQLILTRALGDQSLKKYGVISTPYISKHFISEKDKYIVIASDGVWDVLADEDIFRMNFTVTNCEEFANAIIKNSLARGSQDNISCIVVKLN